MGNRRRTWAAIILILVGVVCVLASGPLSGKARSAAGPIDNYDQVIESIRHGLREHSSEITVRFRYSEDLIDELSETVGQWVEDALQETESPREGDYIRYQYGGYTIDISQNRENGEERLYQVAIRPSYFTYLVQEEEVTARLAEVYEALGLETELSDYEKVCRIYSYVCGNVVYDQVHSKHRAFHLRSTAYAALIRGTATCQGYSVLLYRMLRDNGIPCRVITGTATEDNISVFHAWNLVKLDGKWYGLDATWDAGSDSFRYFLKGSSSFSGHVPGEEFQTDTFRYQHPLARKDYKSTA